MSELILVKHAAPRIVEDLPAREWGLSEAGERQCEELHERLGRFHPASLCTSEELKAVQTGERLGSRLRIPVSSRPGLHENDRTGLPFFKDRDQLNARIREFFVRPSERLMGKETADQAHTRFAAAVRRVVGSEQGAPTVIVAHGTVITLLISRANHLNPYPFWLDFQLTSFAIVAAPSFTLRQVIHPAGREPA